MAGVGAVVTGVFVNPALAFPASVPLVGQVYTLHAVTPQVVLTCGCEAKLPVVLYGFQPGQCGACRRVFVVAAVGAQVPGQPVTAQISHGLPQAEAKA